jgi:hypothetical protein
MLVLALLGFTAQVQAQDWVQHFAGGGGLIDIPNAITLDSAGNVIVAGFTYQGAVKSHDMVVLKYSSSGALLWIRTYNGAGSLDDIAYSVATDSADNIYITGGSNRGGATAEDVVTVKYDANGTFLWGKVYNGAANSTDIGSFVALDSTGNVYVAGRTDRGTDDYLLIKYDTNGNQQWVRVYNGTDGSSDEVHALSIDSSDNVLITGESGGKLTGNDYVTLKYDGAGNVLWAKRYTSAGSNQDNPLGMAVDSTGNVYVTGQSTIGGQEDAVTVKYDSAGVQRWVRAYDGPKHEDDSGNAITVDSTGNVYVVCHSAGGTATGHGFSTESDWAILKYTSNGVRKWVSRTYTGGDDLPTSVKVDSNGYVYVTGYITGTTAGGVDGQDVYTAKYDQTGVSPTVVWEHRYKGSGDGVDIGHAMAVDGAGNTYVAISSIGTTNTTDIVTVKYH